MALAINGVFAAGFVTTTPTTTTVTTDTKTFFIFFSSTPGPHCCGEKDRVLALDLLSMSSSEIM